MTILYRPYENLQVSQIGEGDLSVSTPWIDLSFEIEKDQGSWIRKAIENLHVSPLTPEVQRFLEPLKDYFVSSVVPRPLSEFEGKPYETKAGSLDFIDFSTPLAFLRSSGVEYDPKLEKTCPSEWRWDPTLVLEKSKIPETDLYDPLSFITTVTLMRLENEEKEESHPKENLYTILEKALETDENLFFRYMGWVSRQSYHITSNVCHKFDRPIQQSPVLREHLERYRADEAGHHKFMEQTLNNLGFKIEDFEVGYATKFLVDVFEKTGSMSLFAFVCLISIFEPPIHLEEDPLSTLLKKSSKPQAAKGYTMHYKINMEHNHADVARSLCAYFGAQSKNECLFTIRLFELCLHLTSRMEENLPKMI